MNKIVFVALLILAAVFLLRFRPVIKTASNIKTTVMRTQPAADRENYVVINPTGNIPISSPDNITQAIYYYHGPTRFEGDPIFNYVDVTNKQTNKTTTLQLQGPIEYAQDAFFWSPLNNKMYFSHITNGTGIYEIWESDLNGSNSVRVAGFEHDAPEQSFLNSPLGAITEHIAYSSDGKYIASAKVISSTGTIWIFASDGSNAKKIAQIADIQTFQSLEFENMTHHIYFAAIRNGKTIQQTIPY